MIRRPYARNRRASVRRFRPTMLPNLAAWYRADQGITIAIGISQWNDLSGNGRHLLQATGGSQPTFFASGTPSGKPIARFDGVDDTMAVAFALTQPYTVFCTFRSVVVGAASVHDAIYSGQNALNGSFFNDSTPQYYAYAGALGLLVASGIAAGSFHRTTAIFNGASSSLRLDGAQVSAGDAGAVSPNGLALGASGAGTRFANCDHAELIIVTGAASASVVAQVEAYMKGYAGL